MTALVETDLEFARRWASSRSLYPIPASVGVRWFWSTRDEGRDEEACENDLPPAVYETLRRQTGTVFFERVTDAWDALAAALAELRKAVDVLRDHNVTS